MKKAFIPSILLAALTLLAFTEIETISIGTPLPEADLKMEATDGNSYSFQDIKGENGTLVVFSCNTCPFVVGSKDSEGWDGRYNDVLAACEKNNVGMVLVNSNEAKRENGDSMDDMKAYAKERGVKATYVLDKDHVVADAFGARTTPHIFLFGKDDKLAYKGAIDDNVGSASDVKEQWLDDALKALAAGKKIDPSETRNSGCSIKRIKS